MRNKSLSISRIIQYVLYYHSLAKHFHLPAEGNKTITIYTRWKKKKSVISANEIQSIRQDNCMWVISDFDSEIFRKTNAPLFLQGEQAIRSPSMSSPVSDTAVLNNNYICPTFFLSVSLFSLRLFISTHFDERFISISVLWMRPCQ